METTEYKILGPFSDWLDGRCAEWERACTETDSEGVPCPCLICQRRRWIRNTFQQVIAKLSDLTVREEAIAKLRALDAEENEKRIPMPDKELDAFEAAAATEPPILDEEHVQDLLIREEAMAKLAGAGFVFTHTSQKHGFVVMERRSGECWHTYAQVKEDGSVNGMSVDKFLATVGPKEAQAAEEALDRNVSGTVSIDLDEVDWPLLREQKLALLNLPDTAHSDITGIINLLDSIQDNAAELLGEDYVFGV